MQAQVFQFAMDSQAGTPIARDQVSQKERDFGAETLETFRQVITEHLVIQTVDYQLPGTLTI